jgi:HD superfamily phosphodiesterase
MKEVFQNIWDLASPYQSKPEFRNHAKIVLEFAQVLVKIKKAKADIIIPAAILHDIGWSKVSEEERSVIFNKKKKYGKEYFAVRHKHQDAGVKLASQILAQVKYPKKLIESILEIISQHDTRKGFLSEEDGLMRDADKLSRFSKIEFWKDVKKNEYTPQQLYDRLKKHLDEEHFFYSEEAKELARKELCDRKKEFGNS